MEISIIAYNYDLLIYKLVYNKCLINNSYNCCKYWYIVSKKVYLWYKYQFILHNIFLIISLMLKYIQYRYYVVEYKDRYHI